MAPKEAKEILQRMANDNFYGNHVHEAMIMGIDALEKQKEHFRDDTKMMQKPLSTEETELNSIAFLEQLGYTCVPPGKKQKHKFNVGDTIRLKNSYAEYTIESISDGRYYCKGCSIDIDGGNRDYELVRQKPAEWSDWDERIRKTLLDCYEEAGENYASLEWLNGITYGELCYWLEHLRAQPHWKPSEEQMGAIEECLRFYTESTDTHQHLKSLLNDLKTYFSHEIH